MKTNKYIKFFNKSKPSITISYIFFTLCDQAKEKGELDELMEAFLPAYQEAEKREAFEMYNM